MKTVRLTCRGIPGYREFVVELKVKMLTVIPPVIGALGILGLVASPTLLKHVRTFS